MKTIKIPDLPNKADEIELIKKFVEALPPDCYLEHLLKDLPEFCEIRINDDCTESPLEVIRALQRNFHKANMENVDLKGKLTVATNQLDIAHEALSDRKLAVYSQNESIEKLQEAERVLRTELTARDHEILILKAKLYDLLNK